MKVRSRCRVLLLATAASLSAQSGLRAGQVHDPTETNGSITNPTSTNVSVLAAEAGAAPAETQVSPLQQFKDFLSSPPVIEQLVFARRQEPSEAMLHLGRGLASSTNYEYFEAIWFISSALMIGISLAMDFVHQARERCAKEASVAALSRGSGYPVGVAPVQGCARTVLRLLPLAALAADVSQVAAQAGEGSDSPSLLEGFKSFISSPPIIKNPLFQEKVLIGGGSRPLSRRFALSTSYEYSQGRRQSDGLLFRRISGPLGCGQSHRRRTTGLGLRLSARTGPARAAANYPGRPGPIRPREIDLYLLQAEQQPFNGLQFMAHGPSDHFLLEAGRVFYQSGPA